MMISVPKTEMTGHQAASTVGDMTRYVRTLQPAASTRATTSVPMLKRKTMCDWAPDGESRKNAQTTTPAIGSKTKRATITAAL